MGREEKTKEKVQKISLGIFNTVVDLSLFLFAFWAQSYRVGSGRKDIFEALKDSGKFVKIIKREYFMRGVYQATRKELLGKTGGALEVTEFGRRRLQETLPKYRTERSWDGKVYLITYDIPEKRKKDRELLRAYLKKIGCGMLQASVWLTPYDPRKILANFISDYKLSGLVVVSDIGKDGNVGQMPIVELVKKVYKLDKLNDRYREFLLRVRKGELTSWELAFLFLAILRDDPQLPFSLLLKDWLGDKAYHVFRKASPQI